MENRKYGYIRVSSKEQNENRQVVAMKENGINERDIFMDKGSGKDFKLSQYQLLKRILRPGDILYIHTLDRFDRPKVQISGAFMNTYDELKNGDITSTQAMQQANVKKTTFYKLVKQGEEILLA